MPTLFGFGLTVICCSWFCAACTPATAKSAATMNLTTFETMADRGCERRARSTGTLHGEVCFYVVCDPLASGASYDRGVSVSPGTLRSFVRPRERTWCFASFSNSHELSAETHVWEPAESLYRERQLRREFCGDAGMDVAHDLLLRYTRSEIHCAKRE